MAVPPLLPLSKPPANTKLPPLVVIDVPPSSVMLPPPLASRSLHKVTLAPEVVIDLLAAREIPPVPMSNTAALLLPAVVSKFWLMVKLPPSTVIGPAIAIALPKVMSAVLVLLPKDKLVIVLV